MLSGILQKFGLVKVTNDPHTFIAHVPFGGKTLTLIVPVYVDDPLPLGDKRLMDDFERFLPETFEVSSTGDVSFFLGLRICRERGEDRKLRIDQCAFVQTILDRFGVPTDSKPVLTPLPASEDLVPNDAPKEVVVPANRQQYQSMIGSLMYLMLGTPPDLAYSVGKLARFSSNPSPHHFCAVDRVLLYLRTTQNFYLEWYPAGTSIRPYGYTDADYAGDTSDQKSTAGYLFYVGGTAFLWSSKKEPTVTTSTMEAEYIALYLASQQAAWIFQFYKQIGFPLDKPIHIWYDLQAALNIAKAEETHRRAKHLDTQYHSIRERVAEGQTELKWVASENNSADILTKSISAGAFSKHIEAIGLDQDKASEDDEDDEEEQEVAAHLTPPSGNKSET